MKQLLAVSLGAALALGSSLFAPPAQAALPALDSQGQALPTLAPMLERVTPAVVNIHTTGRVRVQESPLFSDPFFRHFFDLPSRPRERVTQSLGSGVVVDAQRGYVITNMHVIDKAEDINVTLNDGRSYKAKVVGADRETDVAVIQIEADKLTALPLADSDGLQVGDFVVAIGNPFGLGQTVTSGIVSALGRSGLGIEGLEDFIQTDASINPGNSGGALVNLKGELIGINTAILSRSGGNIGIGFAIPSNMAEEVMRQLIAHGGVQRGVLGAQAQDLTPQLADAFGIEGGRGAVVTQVMPRSPAAKAGLEPGDIVTAVNGRPVRDASTLRTRIGLLRVGETVTLDVLRQGRQRTFTAKVAEMAAARVDGARVHRRLQGAQLSEIEQSSPLYGRVQGVLVAEVEPGTPAWGAGLRNGDVIVSVNRQAVSDLPGLRKAAARGKQLLLNVRRGEQALFLYFQ